jgi:hypothetical protein
LAHSRPVRPAIRRGPKRARLPCGYRRHPTSIIHQ